MRSREGCKTEDAAAAVGVSQAVGCRWFRHGGGMPPIDLAPRCRAGICRSREREEIALLRAQGAGVARDRPPAGSSPSTISRELRRNAATRGWQARLPGVGRAVEGRAASPGARRPRSSSRNERLREYVQDRLSGQVRAPGRDAGAGPRGRRGRAGTSRTVRIAAGCTAWSPEQIANRLPVDFPDDESMRISHEAIYQALYVQGRGALKRELVACLRTGRALRVPRARSRRKAWAHVTPEVMISERPAEVEDRAVPGHWEGDLLIGLERSAIGTLVERTTRFTMLIHLPREEGYGTIPRTKNGPALAGYGAVTMKNALAATMTTLPEQLRRSLTWDRGKELSAHAAVQDRDRHPGLLRRPAQPLAARHEREHQRPAAPVLPQGHRPVPLDRRRDRSRRRTPSTAGPARPSAGRHPPKPSTSSYCRSNKPVLRRPIEPGLHAVVGVDHDARVGVRAAAGDGHAQRVGGQRGGLGGVDGPAHDPAGVARRARRRSRPCPPGWGVR